MNMNIRESCVRLILTSICVVCAAIGNGWAAELRSALDKAPSVDISAKQPVPMATSSIIQQGVNMAENAADEISAQHAQAEDTYVYDLKKLIIKSRENIKRVNEKIKEQAVSKRNQKREERAREYYQRGIQLNEEGKLDEAREYFEKAVRLTQHPEMTRHIRQSEFKTKAQQAALKREQSQQAHQLVEEKQSRLQDAQRTYMEAVRLYQEKKFREAREQLERVEELSPDYKATRSYLRLVDQDIITSEALSQKQQKGEMENQQKEAETARQREKDEWKKEIDRKENERRTQVNKQAQNVYEEAVALYKEKKYGEAKKRFQEVEWVIPDYKAARNYLGRIDKDIVEKERRVEGEQAKALARQEWEEEVAQRKRELEEKAALEAKEKERLRQLQEEAGFIYQAAVSLFDKGSWDLAYEKFTDVEKILPGFKSSRGYLIKIQQIKDAQRKRDQDVIARESKQKAMAAEKAKRDIAEQDRRAQELATKEAKRKALEERVQKLGEESVPSVAPVKSREVKEVLGLSKQDQLRQAVEISELAQKSAQLYKKIAVFAKDRRMAPAHKKMAQVEQVLNNLKIQKQNLLRQMRQDEERAQQRDLKEKMDAARILVGQAYDEAVMLFRSGKFEESKSKFLEVERTYPNFKSTDTYLQNMEMNAKQVGAKARLEQDRAGRRRLEDIKVQALAEERDRKAVEDDLKRGLKKAQDDEVQSMVDKAAILNDEILAFSKAWNFDSAKSKFVELEKVLESLRNIADSSLVAAVPEKKASPVDKNKLPWVKKQERLPPREREPSMSREIRKRQQEAFQEGVDLYEQKKYEAARVVFDDLAAKGDGNARVYLLKIKDIMDKEVKKLKTQENKEQDDFIANRLRKQRQKQIMNERERLRQQQLTLAMERQKQIVDEERIRERRRVEVAKLRKQEDALVGRERQRIQAEFKRRHAAHGFRKLKPERVLAIPVKGTLKAKAIESRSGSVAVVKSPPVFVKVPAVVALPQDQGPKAVDPPPAKSDITRAQRKAQLALSNKRKKQLEEKYREEQDKKEREFRKKEQEELKQKEEQSRKEEEEALKLKEEKDRQQEEEALKMKEDARQKREEGKRKQEEVKRKQEAVKRKQEEVKRKQEEQKMVQEERDRVHAAQERMALDEKRRDELKQRQESARAQKERRKELERDSLQRQKYLEFERLAAHQRLVEGAELLYKEAMRLYKSKNFAVASLKFKDIEDIVPGYKKTTYYIEKIRLNAMEVPAFVPAELPNVSEAPVPIVPKADMIANLPVNVSADADPRETISSSRDNSIHKTLDLFDPNVP